MHLSISIPEFYKQLLTNHLEHNYNLTKAIKKRSKYKYNLNCEIHNIHFYDINI